MNESESTRASDRSAAARTNGDFAVSRSISSGSASRAPICASALDDLELEALRHVLLAQQREQRRRGPGVAKLPGGPDGDDTHLRVDLSRDVEQRQQRRQRGDRLALAQPAHRIAGRVGRG